MRAGIGGPRALTILLFGVLALTTSVARAQSDERPLAAARADELFREGRQLMKEGRFPEACRKFEESWRLDPAGGTLGSLAACHEAEGKLTLAWQEFNDALAVARRDKRPDREEFAQKRIADLERKLCMVTVAVAPQPEPPRLELRSLQVEIPLQRWASTPVVPGTYVLSAATPSGRRWQHTFTAAAGTRVRIDVPILPAPPPTPTAEPSAAPERTPPDVFPPPVTDARTDVNPKRTWGWVVGGAGLASLAVGIIYGGVAIARNNQSKSHCVNRECDSTGVSLNSDAKKAATIADATFSIGIAAVATGTILLLLSRSPAKPEGGRPRSESVRLRLEPSVGRDWGGVLLRGRW